VTLLYIINDHYICPGQHRAAGGITILFSIKVLYLTIDGTTIFKNFMIKVKEGDVICGACRPCSDR
jgi:hypothetical protein